MISEAVITTRPAPPSFPPPPPPGVHVVKEQVKMTTLVLPPPLQGVPFERGDDESSTTLGSPFGDNRSEYDASSVANSTQSSPRSVLSVISRDVMLYHFQRSLPVRIGVKGLHSVASTDARLVAALSTDELGVQENIAPRQPRYKAPTIPTTPYATAPPGLTLQTKPKSAAVAPPPGLELLATASFTPPSYAPSTFRKELMSIFKDLGVDKNVARGVRRIRAQNVPVSRQAAELADALTYALEEPRGCARRTFVAFIAGLSAAFERQECAKGLEQFFNDVYPDLQEEVPKLAKIVEIELIPTLRSVFPTSEMRSLLPAELKRCAS